MSSHRIEVDQGLGCALILLALATLLFVVIRGCNIKNGDEPCCKELKLTAGPDSTIERFVFEGKLSQQQAAELKKALHSACSNVEASR